MYLQGQAILKAMGADEKALKLQLDLQKRLFEVVKTEKDQKKAETKMRDTAKLARKLRSSVAWTEDRRENLMASFHSRDQYIRLEGAFDTEAKFVALSAEVIANVGAYSCYPTTCAGSNR